MPNAKTRSKWQETKQEVDFLSFCLRNRWISRAQLFQDLFVLFKLNGKRNGFFVEFGATNGKEISNTFVLEKMYDWEGIVCEPNPFWHPELKQNRSCIIDTRCVWKSSGESLEFLVAEHSPELATIESFRNNDHHGQARAEKSASIRVETISLNDLLQTHAAPKIFDYLSIDTEGSEFDILGAFDFAAHTPLIISVEHNHVRSYRELLKTLLEKRGYTREFRLFSRFDDWYCHRDLLDSYARQRESAKALANPQRSPRQTLATSSNNNLHLSVEGHGCS